MKTRYFVTGTDTDTGKTYVMCELLSNAKKNHRQAIGLKPVASACHFTDGELISDDVTQIQQFQSKQLNICPWRFLPPISPHIAAEKSGLRLSASSISEFCLDKQWDLFDEIYIEGAGGLMAPLNETETWIDVVKQADLTIILVVGIRLGCLNHALLTAAVMAQEGLKSLGWIANCLDPNMLALEENIATLQHHLKMPHLATIPYQGHM